MTSSLTSTLSISPWPCRCHSPFTLSQPPFMLSRVKQRYITSLWEDDGVGMKIHINSCHFNFANFLSFLKKKTTGVQTNMRRWCWHLVYVKSVRVCVCVRLGLRFIRVAVEHSMMLNLAYRGFSKNRCMQVVDTTSVLTVPFCHNARLDFSKPALCIVLQAIRPFISFVTFMLIF